MGEDCVDGGGLMGEDLVPMGGDYLWGRTAGPWGGTNGGGFGSDGGGLHFLSSPDDYWCQISSNFGLI